MNLRAQDNMEPELNLTPLIDVVFLLLIFFMVSTTFNRESDIPLELPEATGEVKQQDERVVEISIDAKGVFYVNREELVNTQIKTLIAAIRRAAGDDKEPMLIIAADAETRHQAVVTAIDAAQQLGFRKLSFATNLPGAETGGEASGK